MTGRPMLAVRGVSRSFGSVQALRDVSVEVGTGTMVALVGRSGSGKTTLLNVVGGSTARTPARSTSTARR